MFGWAFQWIVNTWRIKPFFLHPDRKLLLRGQLQRQLVGQNIRLQRCRGPLCCKAGIVRGIAAGPSVEAHLTWRWIACAWCQPRCLIKHTHLVLFAIFSVAHRSSGNTVKPEHGHIVWDNFRIWTEKTADNMAIDKLYFGSQVCWTSAVNVTDVTREEMLFWKKNSWFQKCLVFRGNIVKFWQIQPATS